MLLEEIAQAFDAGLKIEPGTGQFIAQSGVSLQEFVLLDLLAIGKLLAEILELFGGLVELAVLVVLHGQLEAFALGLADKLYGYPTRHSEDDNKDAHDSDDRQARPPPCRRTRHGL